MDYLDGIEQGAGGDFRLCRGEVAHAFNCTRRPSERFSTIMGRHVKIPLNEQQDAFEKVELLLQEAFP